MVSSVERMGSEQQLRVLFMSGKASYRAGAWGSKVRSYVCRSFHYKGEYEG